MHFWDAEFDPVDEHGVPSSRQAKVRDRGVLQVDAQRPREPLQVGHVLRSRDPANHDHRERELGIAEEGLHVVDAVDDVSPHRLGLGDGKEYVGEAMLNRGHSVDVDGRRR